MRRKTLSEAARELDRIERRETDGGSGGGDLKAMVGVDPMALPIPEEAAEKIEEWTGREESSVSFFESEAEAREAGLPPGSTIGWDPAEEEHEVLRPGEERGSGTANPDA